LINPNKIINEASRIINKLNHKKQKILETEEYLDTLLKIDYYLFLYAQKYIKDNVITVDGRTTIKLFGLEEIIKRMISSSIISADQANDLVKYIKIGNIFKNSFIKRMDKEIVEKTLDLSKKLKESVMKFQTEEN
jgi:hypothetical protein